MIHVTGDDVAFKNQSYVQPMAWYCYQDGKAEKTALVTQSPVDFRDIEVKREFAKSKDGTQVPMTILYRKGTKRDGKNPDASLRIRRLQHQPDSEIFSGHLYVARVTAAFMSWRIFVGEGSSAKPGIAPEISRTNKTYSMISSLAPSI